jgi:hemerythrin superfamily protein
MFLIADLIEIIGITTGPEIVECLKEWGYTVDRDRFRKYLSLLQHLKLIRKKRHGDKIYYVSVATLALIRFDFISGSKLRDLGRIKTLIRESLLKNDKRRMKIYKRELLSRSRPRRRHV